ncbi:MAG: CDF family Co(II)/Ni(II) efflux transporter DmeF, partial [Caulobacterales bacterium]|nr:CDF family Co(II)/Ni(II) efflux transporter DmeF [Caulobacterales bacterium]
MHRHDLSPWRHDHVFGQDAVRSGERRTALVVALTAAMMVVEIAAGVVTGSMALLADGLHMASHAVALGVSLFAYIYTRRVAADPRYTFGAGKVNSLAAFASAVLLAGFALAMVVESLDRLANPVAISFDQALIVAVVGLVVNALSAVILAGGEHHHHHHGHGHDHAHGQGAPEHRHGDQNLRAAYLHVLADALTSLLAIFALLAGKFAGLAWLDPAMGLLGAALVARWSWGLIGETSAVLLDRAAPDWVAEPWRRAIEAEHQV